VASFPAIETLLYAARFLGASGLDRAGHDARLPDRDAGRRHALDAPVVSRQRRTGDRGGFPRAQRRTAPLHARRPGAPAAWRALIDRLQSRLGAAPHCGAQTTLAGQERGAAGSAQGHGHPVVRGAGERQGRDGPQADAPGRLDPTRGVANGARDLAAGAALRTGRRSAHRRSGALPAR
jgi:hypothetical protein